MFHERRLILVSSMHGSSDKTVLLFLTHVSTEQLYARQSLVCLSYDVTSLLDLSLFIAEQLCFVCKRDLNRTCTPHEERLTCAVVPACVYCLLDNCRTNLQILM
jgi:hypothetical protein